MQKKEQTDLLLSLIRAGLGKGFSAYWTQSQKPNESDWVKLQAIAEKHGLTAIVLDGLDKSTKLAETVPLAMKLEWIGQVLQNYVQRYDLYRKAHTEMASFYNSHGYKMMGLKGFAVRWTGPDLSTGLVGI